MKQCSMKAVNTSRDGVPVVKLRPAILRVLHLDRQQSEQEEEHDQREEDAIDGRVAEQGVALVLCEDLRTQSEREVAALTQSRHLKGIPTILV